MDKLKMELTWYNCKIHPPKEVFNSRLTITDGYNIDSFTYYNKYGFPIPDDELHEYWWTDLSKEVRRAKEFNKANNLLNSDAKNIKLTEW